MQVNLNQNGNEIKSIPAHAFVGLPKLEVIALDANGISEIEDGAFEVRLRNMQLLILYHYPKMYRLTDSLSTT